MNPRVLQVITDADRRGAQVFASDLGAELDGEFAVRTVALAPGRSGGLDVDVLGTSRLAPSTLRSLRRAARGSAVVVAHGSSTLPACAAALLGSGIPFVYRQISDPVFWTPSASRRLRVRTALGRARHVVALWSGSATVLHERFGVPEERITVVPNGVPPRPAVDAGARTRARARFELAADEPVVAYVGALVPEKGIADLVRALASVPARLLVAGEGPARSRRRCASCSRIPIGGAGSGRRRARTAPRASPSRSLPSSGQAYSVVCSPEHDGERDAAVR